MANKFWVGGSGNWNDTTHWSTVSGGAGSAGVPGTGDAAIVDAHASGLNGGTLTINQNVAIQGLNWTGCVGTIDNSGNFNMAFTASPWFNGGGSGTRSFIGGTGTYSIVSDSNATAMWTISTVTGFTNAATAFLNCTIEITNTDTPGAPPFVGGAGVIYGTVTLKSNANKGGHAFNSANQITTLNIEAPNTVYFPGAITQTLTNFNITGGSSANRVALLTLSASSSAILAISGSASVSWALIQGITVTGAASPLTATNSLDLGHNVSVTVTAPSGGGSSGVIGS